MSTLLTDVRVYVAFNAGFTTPAASRTWTEISQYVEADQGITIKVGRQDELSQADANELTLTLDNSDGRFTPQRASSPYYPNVKLYRPILVNSTDGDGLTRVKFLGYVSVWGVGWDDGQSSTSQMKVTAVSAIGLLGQRKAFASIIEEYALLDSPFVYYTLGESDGATSVADSSGTSAASLPVVGTGAAITFGDAIGPGTDSLTAAQFNAGQYLAGGLGKVIADTSLTGVTVECFLSTTTAAVFGVQQGIVALTPSASTNAAQGNAVALDLILSGSSTVVRGIGPNGNFIESGTINDGLTHHVAITVDALGNGVLYVDGSVADSFTLGTATGLGYLNIGGGWGSFDVPFNGVLAHVGVYAAALSATEIANHYTAGSTGFVERTDLRFARYATLSGMGGVVSAETGNVSMASLDITGMQPLDALRAVEDTEAGIVYDAANGTTTLQARYHRITAAASTTALVFDLSKQEVEADYAPQMDSTGLLNDVTVTLPYESARYVDPTSVNDYGTFSEDVTSYAASTDRAASRATWLVNQFKDPQLRVQSVTVDVLNYNSGSYIGQVGALDVSSLVRLTNLPGQAPGTTVDYFVEGWTDTITHESWMRTLNISPAAFIESVLIIGSATRGLIGTNVIGL